MILFTFNKVAKNCSEAGESIVKRFQYKMIECSDPNDNTALSEAAAGGSAIIRFFILCHALIVQVTLLQLTS